MDLLKSAVNAFNSLNDRIEEIRDIFSQRQDENGRLNVEANSDIFDDLGAALSMDCEGAKLYFTRENENIPSEYDLSQLTFEEFFELFGMWIQQGGEENLGENQEQEEERQEENLENENNQEEEQNEEEGDNQENEENENQGNNEEENQEDRNDQEEQEEHHTHKKEHKGQKQPKVSGVSNYEKNKQIFDEMLANYMQDFESVFYHMLGESGEEKLSLAGCFEFFRECCQISAVDLKEKKGVQEPYFNVPENQQSFIEIAQNYLQSKPREPREDEEQEEQPANDLSSMAFNECFDFLDYWLRTDFYLVLVDHSKEVEESSVFKTLFETIQKYEKLIEECQNEVERDVLQTTVDTLKNKLAQLKNPKAKSEALDNNSSPTGKAGLTEAEMRRREAKRNVVLKEIFDFYCTQQLNVGRSSTFDRLGRLAGTINIGTFRVFLTTFKMSMDHLKLLELYKKSAGLDENLQFHEFMDLLNKVAWKVDLVTETKTHEPNYAIMKNYKPDSYKKDPTYRNFKKEDDKRREEDMKTIIKKTRKQYLDYNKRDAEQLEEVWEHMGLYNGMYKQYMGMIQLPFNSQDKENFRIPPGSLKYKFRTQAMEGKSIAEIKDEVNKRNEMRKLVKDLKTLEKSLLMTHKPSINSTRAHERSSVMDVGNTSYIKKQYTRTTKNGNGPDMSKMTMKKIGGMGYGDVKRVDEQFDPNDLIDENDEEDNIYLAEYNLSAEKKKVEELVENEKKKVEEYGKLKKPAKGFATNGRYGNGYTTPGKRNTVGELASDTQSVAFTADYGSGRPSAHNTSNLISTKATNSNLTTIVHSKSSKLIPGVPAQYPEYTHMSPQVKSTKNMYASPEKQQPGAYNYASPRGYYPDNSSYMVNNGYYGTKSPGYNYAVDRANQIETDLRRREQEMIRSVMSIQDKQVKKGLKAVGK